MAAAVLVATCGSGPTATTPTTRTTAPTASTSTPPSGTAVHRIANRPVHAVGILSEEFVDPSRPTPAAGGAPASPTRSLPTLVLYPARGGPGPGDVASGAPDRAGGPYPLIVFAHGIDAVAADNEPLLRQWAARGFVVAAPTFPLSRHGAPGGPTVADLAHQPADLSFVIGQLLALDDRSGQPLWHLVDRSRIALGGHSLGAGTVLAAALNTCCHDPRVRAVFAIEAFEGSFGPGTGYSVAVPLLVIHGTLDPTIPYIAGRHVYDASPPPKYLVSLLGGPHTPFRQAATASRPAPRWEPVIVAAVSDFLAGHLEGDTAALARLVSDATVPGVATIASVTR